MLHLSLAHHKISKHDSPHKIDTRTTEISQIQIQTEASQLLLTIKPMYWPLGFSNIFVGTDEFKITDE
jgi:hypothetical protein